MPYGFNGDKSKYDLDQIANRFVVMEGASNNAITSGGISWVNINTQQAASAGIDDISNFVLVGLMYSTNGGATWRSDMEQGATDNTAYPPPVTVALGYTANVPIHVQFKNSYASALTMNYRIVLMRID